MHPLMSIVETLFGKITKYPAPFYGDSEAYATEWFTTDKGSKYHIVFLFEEEDDDGELRPPCVLADFWMVYREGQGSQFGWDLHRKFARDIPDGFEYPEKIMTSEEEVKAFKAFLDKEVLFRLDREVGAGLLRIKKAEEAERD